MSEDPETLSEDDVLDGGDLLPGFTDITGILQWSKDQRFATRNARWRNADALDPFVESWTIQHTAEDVMTPFHRAPDTPGLSG